MTRKKRRGRTDKVAKTYRLSDEKIATSQKILGAPTATAVIEEALDMVVFRKELIDGVTAMRGVKIAPLFEPE